ncbi:LamG-like jellyroll fold domain-containing protein, partial [Streptomyces sp. NPDC097619]|uniref:LamG-like jellyroll fold domain-containing protein n=1 Tax=Streptomyces sp. NPDC097619 TaxID=3157228 RepID=UPI00332B0BC2
TSYDADDSKLTYKIYRNGAATPVATVTADSLEWERRQASWTDTTVKAGQSYTYRISATDAAGNVSALSATAPVTVPTSVQAYPNQVRSDGATLYWRYEDTVSPFTADSSAGGNTSGLQINTPTLRAAPGAVTGTAYGFNGTDEQVHSDHRQSVGSTYSLETWFKTDTTRGGKLIGFGNNTTRTSKSHDKHVYLTNTGRLVFGVYTGGLPRTITTPAQTAYNDNKWHHVVATQGPGGMTLYVDGQVKGTLNVTAHQKFAGYWHVGGDNISDTWPLRPTSTFFAGQIDETAVYPTALTAAQVQNHHDLAKAPADTVSEVSATEDTYINQGAPSASYGSSTSLAVRGTGSLYESYLRFNLPAAPAGQVLKAASLQIKTSTQTGAGTANTVSVVPVTGTWSGTSTFTTKPTLG